MKRYAAHQIVLEDGTAIEQGIVELSDGGIVARTFPFWHEQPMTEWLGGVIEVKADEADASELIIMDIGWEYRDFTPSLPLSGSSIINKE